MRHGGGRRDGQDVALGNSAATAIDTETRQGRGETVMYLVVDGRIAGRLAVADPTKATAPDALAALRGQGLRIVMATGDNPRTAEAVAARLGVDDVRADMLPEDKARIVRELQVAGRTVAMAGDGVNDAPALAQADVGIAMGAGAGVAIESAGFTLIKGT